MKDIARIIIINDWRFVVGTKHYVTSFITSMLQKHHPGIFLAASLNDLAQAKNRPHVRVWYQAIDYFTTDGVPLTWRAQFLTKQPTERVYGPTLMSDICAWISYHAKSSRNIFLGPSQQTLRAISSWATTKKNRLLITGLFVVPYDDAKLQRLFHSVQQSKPDVIWVGVGSPRQAFIASRLKILIPHATIFCVGAALELLTGTKSIAPAWMQQAGLEWFYRLLHEPARLWKRYLVDIPIYLLRLTATGE